MRITVIAVIAVIVCTACVAEAQVLEIADDGSVTTYAGPTVFTADGGRAIVSSAARPAPATAGPVGGLIALAALRHGVDPRLAAEVAWQESRFQQASVSPKGARGVMQLMPATARDLGVDPDDLHGNIDGGVGYLALQLRRFGDVGLALAAYNAGPEAVVRYGGIPPFQETRAYVRAILSRLGPPNLPTYGAQ